MDPRIYLLVVIAVITTYVSYINPALGAAIAVAMPVVAVVYSYFKDNDGG